MFSSNIPASRRALVTDTAPPNVSVTMSMKCLRVLQRGIVRASVAIVRASVAIVRVDEHGEATRQRRGYRRGGEPEVDAAAPAHVLHAQRFLHALDARGVVSARARVIMMNVRVCGGILARPNLQAFTSTAMSPAASAFFLSRISFRQCHKKTLGEAAQRSIYLQLLHPRHVFLVVVVRQPQSPSHKSKKTRENKHKKT